MTSVPDALRKLRHLVSVSYEMRSGVWRADPMLVEQLVAAEQAWGRELRQMREAVA